MQADQIDLDDLAADGREQQSSAPQSEVTLNMVKQLAEKLALARVEVELAESALEAKKEAFRKLSEDTIPEAFNAAGLALGTVIALADGWSLTVEETVRASISEENRPKAFAWLRERGHDDLIKNVVTVSFGKGEESDAAQLVQHIKEASEADKLHFGQFERKESVHNATLTAFVKEQLELGVEFPTAIFGVFTPQVAKLRPPKKRK